MEIYDDGRLWGSERVFIKNQPVTVKLLFVKKGEQLSLQYHNHRDEFERVIVGSPHFIIGETEMVAKVGDEIFIPRGTKHRLSAVDDDVTILEIALGDFDENDIVRLQDKYNRIAP